MFIVKKRKTKKAKHTSKVATKDLAIFSINRVSYLKCESNCSVP
jgi:hypothetical protein